MDTIGEEQGVNTIGFVIVILGVLIVVVVTVVVATGWVMVIGVCRFDGHQMSSDSQVMIVYVVKLPLRAALVVLAEMDVVDVVLL